MKNIKKNRSKAGQSSTALNKPNKHDANVQKNTTLYFQIGLILCLLGSYLLLEMQFEDKTPRLAKMDYDNELIEVVQPEVTIWKEPEVKSEPVKKKQVLTDEIIIKDDIPEALDEIITPDETPEFNEPVKIEDVIVEKIPIDVEVPFNFVEVVPVFPGCEKAKTNEDRRQCMSDKISRLVQRKFNTDIGEEYGLSGKQRIDVQFKIDKTGKVVDIKTRAPHPALEKEAKRVINKIPEMTPGRMQNKPVGVLYQLPIKFQVQD